MFFKLSNGSGKMFKFLKKEKKKKESKSLPPPLPPEKKPKMPVGDIPAIVPDKKSFPKKDLAPVSEKEELKQKVPIPPRPKMAEKAEFPYSPAVERAFPAFEKPAPKVFDKTIEEELPSKKVRSRLKPIFVGVDDYNEIMNHTNVIRSKLLEAEDFAKKLNHLKSDENKLLDKWQSKVEEIDKKLTYVDKVVSNAQG